MKNKICEVVFATVAEGASGIHIRLMDIAENVSEKDKFFVVFVPRETWGRIPADKDPNVELQIIADNLNGYRTNQLLEKELIGDGRPKRINIETE